MIWRRFVDVGQDDRVVCVFDPFVKSQPLCCELAILHPFDRSLCGGLMAMEHKWHQSVLRPSAS